MKILITRFLLLGLITVCAVSAYAQSSDAPPVDEVIARVNSGVIMRSTYEAAQKEQLEQMKNAGLKGAEL